MDRYPMQDLDALIDGVLRDEPEVAVPAGFRRRLNDKIQIYGMALRERRHFRRSLIRAFGAASSIIVGVALAIWLANVPGSLASSIPGFYGFYDHAASRIGHSWPGLIGSALVAGCALGIVMILLEVAPLRRRAT